MRELRDDRLEARVDLEERFDLRGRYVLSRAGKLRDELERVLLDRHCVAGRKLRDPAVRVSRVAQRIRERLDPREDRFNHHAGGSDRTLHSRQPARYCPATVIFAMRIEPVCRDPLRSTSRPTATMSRNICFRLPAIVISSTG